MYIVIKSNFNITKFEGLYPKRLRSIFFYNFIRINLNFASTFNTGKFLGDHSARIFKDLRTKII
jgi:hypothetical protein